MIKDVLQYFDIRLFSLANYLDIPLDRMKSLNSGRVSFKPEEIMQLHTLHKALDLDTSTENLPNVPIYKHSLQEKFANPIKGIIKGQNRLLLKKEKRLAKSKRRFLNMKRGLITSQKLFVKLGSVRHQKTWLDICERHLGEKLQDMEFELVVLEAQIKGIKSQVEFLHAQLEKQILQEA